MFELLYSTFIAYDSPSGTGLDMGFRGWDRQRLPTSVRTTV